ncbi:putative T-complex protein 11 [Seiridium unicorne]|uniref:T-complex protein 11 n=1 Tax=Seiridium unicorne TaxID=138068 RepID=A0ABR2VCH0_9PEZI
MGDQGAGGIESSGKRRYSEPNPNSHEDQIQQQVGQAETPNPEAEEQKVYPQNDSPRGLAQTPALSRQPSTGSNASESSYQSRTQHSKDARRRLSRHNTPEMRAQTSRPLEPPVTKSTLSELDVQKIVHNPKLRHDINFDPELHFRPNLDGEKGRRKQDKANQFWLALRQQLEQFVANPIEFQERYHNREWCLPLLLRSVKEIIQTLVPTRDRAYLDEGLNVDLLMQQFNRGVADLEKLASWLSGVLKSHCAPMRDEWVDEMYSQLTNGNRTNNMEELVQGMRSLLSVLEAMKLDVANHQIRCLRPILIEDTVHFEQKFFKKKIQTAKLEPLPAQQWYHLATLECQPDHVSRATFGDMAVFFEALSRLILPSNPEPFPNTFLFDEERMYKLRSDMLDAINLEICMRLFEELEKKYKHSAIPTPLLATPFADALGFLTAGSDDESEFNFNSSSRPASLVFSSAGSASSSPRSSMILPSTIPTSSPADMRAKSRNLYSSLTALLSTSPSTSRPSLKWKAMKDSLALQIFRFTDAPQDVLLQFEDELDQHLSEPDSSLFQDVEQHFHSRLMTQLQQRVREFKAHTGVNLFSAATGGRIHGPSRTWDGSRERSSERDTLEPPSREAREEGGIEDMATRLTHLGILHWRVWSGLVYNAEVEDTEMDTSA